MADVEQVPVIGRVLGQDLLGPSCNAQRTSLRARREEADPVPSTGHLPRARTLDQVAGMEPGQPAHPQDFLHPPSPRHLGRLVRAVADVEVAGVVLDEPGEPGGELGVSLLVPNKGEYNVLGRVGSALPLLVGLVKRLVVGEAKEEGAEQGGQLAWGHPVGGRVRRD